ncbi:MAG: cyclopropane-fatty-acyl-phospholipid synthase family protein [Gemmatimonadota bacterium]|nr:cyclopropane-fatty-acyl-phospholipid synthase family protein [Gemmatimonadota bacterium]
MSEAGAIAGSTTGSRRGSLVERWAGATLARGLEGLRHGSLTIREPGVETRYRGDLPGPEVNIAVHDAAFYRRMLLDGENGAGESYILGEWSSDSVTDAVTLGILNRRSLKRGSPLFWLGAIGAWVAHQTRANTRRRAARNIHEHYDLGNDFFELFLDPTMTYSCAYFDDPAAPFAELDRTLEAAQIAKYRRIAEKAGLSPGDHVLEIGCGWGGFAEVAASEYGCRVTGLTISREQAAFARARIEAAGLHDQVSIELRDYRTLAEAGGAPDRPYDHVVSIEMLEAVGHRFLPRYFETIDGVLARGGRAVVQVITIPDERYLRYRMRPDYIQKFIFPGAHLPSLGAMTRAMRRTELRIADREDLAPHYAPTLATWRRRLLARRAEAAALGFDEAFMRRWEFYFAYCEAAFATRHVANYHLVLDRLGP